MDKTAPNYKWVLVALLLCVGAVNYGDRSAIASVFPAIRADLLLSNMQLAGIGTFFLWSYALASPFAGALADRFSRRTILLWSLVAWSSVTLLTALVADSRQLVISRILLGLAEAPGLPAALALIADYHSSATRATAMGLYMAGSSLGVVAGGTSMGYLGQRFGWRPGFVVLGAVGLVLAAVAHYLLPNAAPRPAVRAEKPRGESMAASFASVLSVPTYLVVLLVGMAVAVGHWIFANWLPLYFRETYGMSLVGAGFAGTFALQIAALAGGVIGGIFSDRVAGGNLRRRMTIQIVACLGATPFLLAFHSARPELVRLNVCIFMFSFLLKFGTANLTVLTCDLLPPNRRAAALGIANSANCFAGGAGIMVAGFFKSTMGLGGVFAGISIMTTLAALLLILARQCFLARDITRLAAGLAPSQTRA